MKSALWLAPLILTLSWAMTGLMRRYALSRSLLDIPNARSSHTLPTPRGGGVAIVLGFCFGVALLMHPVGGIERDLAVALLGSGITVALLGFLDDHGHVAARWRLLGHFLAAGWVLYWLDGFSVAVVLGLPFELSIAGYTVAALFLVWLLNLYNFMDGIDGIAGAQAVFFGLGLALILWWRGEQSAVLVPLILASAALGFLFWNFPPAKIFMGDAGSGFLGIVVATMTLHGGTVEPALFWAGLILLAPFVSDATITLIDRLVKGERVYEAHSTHAYQFAARRFGRHLPVTLGVCAINLGWLLPVSIAVGTGALGGTVGMALAYLPLTFLVVLLRRRSGAG